MKKIDGGVTAAKGYKAAATAAGIKYQNRTDMAMVYSEVPATIAGTFTTNVFKAAPVIWDRNIVKNIGKAQAIVVNSGIANACTGTEGDMLCQKTADAAAEALGIEADAVLLGSTGVIGMQLPINRMQAGARTLAAQLKSGLEAGTEAAQDNRYPQKRDCIRAGNRWQDSDHRRYGKRIGDDPSEYVYHACICDNRRSYFS